MRSGSHDAVRWWTQVPAHHPGQPGGPPARHDRGIPAFRWYDQDAGRVIVANRPADAAVDRGAPAPTGAGCWPTAASASRNLFTGDAPTALLTMSRARPGAAARTRRRLRALLRQPVGLARALCRRVGRDRQGACSRPASNGCGATRAPDPRRGSLRRRCAAVTNVLLRDLNVALVAEHMIAGRPSSTSTSSTTTRSPTTPGSPRPESLDALEGIDRVLGLLEQVAARRRGRYRFVVLSDHGQSQGATFRQLTGRTLEDAVRPPRHAPGDVGRHRRRRRDVGSGQRAPVGGARRRRRTARWAPRPPRRRQRRPRPHADAHPTTGVRPATLVVVGSGNLGLVWFPRLPRPRRRRGAVQAGYPALVAGLLAEPGVGFVVADSAARAAGHRPGSAPRARRRRRRGHGPACPVRPAAAARPAAGRAAPTSPPTSLCTRRSTRAREVHAFEELVGSHGGLGGWQNEACWSTRPTGRSTRPPRPHRPGRCLLYGADVVHRQLVRWLEAAGTGGCPCRAAP